MKIEEQYVKDVDKLLPCPDIALAVLKIAHESDCNVPELSRQIEKDPTLTANMLKMANSAYFGHMKRINSVTDIIVRLGMETVKLIAITSASMGLLGSSQKAYNLISGALWRHSYATAILASILGRYAEHEDAAGLYTAALLHDIGKVILNKHLQREIYNADEPQPGTVLVAYERSLLHTDHARVGEALLLKWGLPDSITGPVGAHHLHPQPEDALPATGIVRLANILTEQMGFHSMDEGHPLTRIAECLAEESEWPDVPNFIDNRERIIEEFFTKYNESSSIFFSLNDQ
ncbi:MAG: HDOD domain-containing protein [Desulfobulbaceae bacterium]|nr:HDOD domain-containing protein [Desulfobulbaceae bacterium]